MVRAFVNVNLYANDAPDPSGYGEGQYFLGVASAKPGSGTFTFRHPHDLRGKWVAATQTQINYYGFLRAQGTDHLAFSTTSEVSRAVEVR